MHKIQQSNRILVLQKTLCTKQIDAAIINLSRDLFYYAGTAQPCFLIVTQDDYRLLVRRAHDFVLKETFLDREKIENKASLSDALKCLDKLSIKDGKLGLELDVIPAQLYLKMKKIFSKFKLVNISDEILQQRMVKDDQEIKDIEVACKIMDAGHQRVLKTLQLGMTELQLAAEVEYAHRRAGHEGVLSMRNFDFYISRGPLSSGKNLFKTSGFANTITGVGLSPAVPAGPSNSIINIGDLVIIDIPTCHKGYHCDQTRTYFLGSPSKEIKDLFAKLKAIFNAAVSTLKAGVTCNQVFKATYEKADSLGVAQYFLGLNPRKGNFVGHGIGLDANEPPILFSNSEFKLLENFVITIEIHLTHSEYGAVKLEDVVLIEKNGCRILTVTPQELFCIVPDRKPVFG